MKHRTSRRLPSVRRRRAPAAKAVGRTGRTPPRRPPPMLIRDMPDEIVLQTCERFLKGETVADIGTWLKATIPGGSREKIYPMMREAVRRGLLQLRSRMDYDRPARIRERFPNAPSDIAVVKAFGPYASDHVACQAAQMALTLIKQLDKDQVHIGFGAGNTVKRVVRYLSEMLQDEDELPALALHALGTGFAVTDPSTSAATFLGFFHSLEKHTPVEYFNLLAAPFVKWNEYAQLRNRKDLQKYFEAAESIDIVITTLNSAHHEHGLLDQFMRLQGGPHREQLKDAGWVGDVLWRPYSTTGPITQDTGIRAVTILELDQLVRMAGKRDKHIIMVAGPCSLCGEDKSVALRPLLSAPTLRLCNHLVTDLTTAEHLIREPRNPAVSA